MKNILSIIAFSLCVSAFCQTPQNYTSFDNTSLSLYAWQGNKIMLLSSSNTLNPTTMNNWVLKMDTAYNYYALCTGQEPTFYTGVTYINNRSTIAQVPTTCGAGCGYLGWTGIEMLTSYFDNMYNYINNQNLYDQIPFYELGRNFWFYDNQLKYQSNDPIVTGYAVFMRFMAMEAANVQGAPFNSWTFSQFKNNVINLLPSYMADPTLNWGNTLGVGQGVPNSNLGGTDLFASFCFYLRDNYCGNHWVENVWKFAGLRPTATNTQDAVDNFVIASSQAANTNLTSLFQYWKWTVSSNAISYLNSLNLGRINSQPVNSSANLGDNTQFSVSSSDDSAVFQWQIDTGSGFQNITNNNQFNGTNTNTLSVLNLTTSNNNNLFRCLVSIGSCTDTSSTATLFVSTTSGINDLTTKNNLIAIYPNPTNSTINFSVQTNVELTNVTGQIVANEKNVNTVNISKQPAGVYFVTLTDDKGQVLQCSKIVKER